MMCLDLFLNSLNQKERLELKHKISALKSKPHALMSIDIVGSYLAERTTEFQKIMDLKCLNTFIEKYQWRIDLDNLLKTDYTALVLTNAEKKIIWANKGFTKMTGYPMNFAVGKRPNFLQGKETSQDTINRFRENLKLGIPFSETIINYTKNKTPYNCHVRITPLRNKEDIITHFIALEKKV